MAALTAAPVASGVVELVGAMYFGDQEEGQFPSNSYIHMLCFPTWNLSSYKALDDSTSSCEFE